MLIPGRKLKQRDYPHDFPTEGNPPSFYHTYLLGDIPERSWEFLRREAALDKTSVKKILLGLIEKHVNEMWE